MSHARQYGARTPAEIAAVCNVMAAITHDALRMVLTTPREARAVEILALRATIPDRLIAQGVAPERAAVLARGIKVNVEIAADEN